MVVKVVVIVVLVVTVVFKTSHSYNDVYKPSAIDIDVTNHWVGPRGKPIGTVLNRSARGGSLRDMLDKDMASGHV